MKEELKSELQEELQQQICGVHTQLAALEGQLRALAAANEDAAAQSGASLENTALQALRLEWESAQRANNASLEELDQRCATTMTLATQLAEESSDSAATRDAVATVQAEWEAWRTEEGERISTVATACDGLDATVDNHATAMQDCASVLQQQGAEVQDLVGTVDALRESEAAERAEIKERGDILQGVCEKLDTRVVELETKLEAQVAAVAVATAAGKRGGRSLEETEVVLSTLSEELKEVRAAQRRSLAAIDGMQTREEETSQRLSLKFEAVTNTQEELQEHLTLVEQAATQFASRVLGERSEVQIQCPDGVSGGDTLSVELDFGAVDIVVPAGVNSGETFAVEVPSPADAPDDVVNVAKPAGGELGALRSQMEQKLIFSEERLKGAESVLETSMAVSPR